MPSTPPPLAGRRIVLGVCGSIAAYKAAELCRRLVEAGAYVSPVMTAGATRFLGTVTLSALGSEAVRTSLWDEQEPAPHIGLARSADLIVVAPATARVLGAYAAGLSDDLLTATLLATRAPVLVCPAMHTEMWEHPATVDNVALLRRRGVQILEPAAGPLAGGDVGVGRLSEPAAILDAVVRLLATPAAVTATPATATPDTTVTYSTATETSAVTTVPDLAGLRVLVTAGGTREPLDAVRFLGNRSSGKQGHALAAEASARGADVTLITTAGGLPVAPGINAVAVDTAAEMEAEVLARAGQADIVVMAAAVADFRPKAPAFDKIKKADGVPEVILEPTTDILAAVGRTRRTGQVLVGFAAETCAGSELADRARAKLRDKHVDLVVANDVSAAGAGFGHDTNAVVVVGADGSEQTVSLTDKREIAAAVLDAVVDLLRKRNN